MASGAPISPNDPRHPDQQKKEEERRHKDQMEKEMMSKIGNKNGK